MAGPDVATGPFGGLQEQLLGAAEQFGSGPVAQILSGMVEDVDRALREPLEIFPVCHHSPSSATAMARRLHEKRPKVIYLELCEDLRPLLKELRHCRPPVALQAFATDVDGFPAEWVPLSVVAPITEASAEYQAIAYALTTPGVELVLVDRSADHVFQWERRDAGQRHRNEDEEALHGDAVGVEIGDLRPRFTELEEHLLHHGKVRHWSEWWDQYVEQPLINADYDTYRQVMVLIGSLFRRLRSEDAARTVVDEKRERYMWTRIRQHLASSGADPADCLYVCGAFHAASRVEEFGLHGRDGSFEIPPRTATSWQYGLIPSSHSAIEAQFGLAPGSVSIAAATWTKALRRTGVAPFRLGGASTTKKSAKAIRSVEAMEPAAPVTDRLAPLGLDLEKHTRQRALLDLNTDPHLQPCSDLLWILRRLLGCDAVQPIMGSRRLGERSIQESWDLAIGRHMQSIIELGYEGVTAEQVFQQRLRKAVHAPKATAAFALAAVEDSLCYLRSRRFADALGARAVELLAAERTVDDAPEVLRRARRLLAYYQTTDSELPEWLQAFVTAGYAHYCTLLPIAFADDDAGARQVAAMLGFLLGMEGLALSLGCQPLR